MNEVDILYLVWMWLLPALAVMWSVLVPVVWFFIVPKISKRLMWARFKNANIIAMADDSGYVDLMVTTKNLPEGLHHVEKRGWFYQCRAMQTEKPKDENTKLIEQIVTRKYILKDLGKPIWFCYAGKATLFNPQSLALLEGDSQEKVASSTKKVKILDLKNLASVIDQMVTPSQSDALATYSEMIGMEKKGHEYGKLIIGGALIIGLVILGIVAISYLMK